MKLFKRVTATVLAALMLAMSLAGCSGEEKEEPEEPKNLITVSKSVMSGDSYGDTKLAQGRDAAKNVIRDNPELADELEAKIMEAMQSGVKPAAKPSKSSKQSNKEEE